MFSSRLEKKHILTLKEVLALMKLLALLPFFRVIEDEPFTE